MSLQFTDICLITNDVIKLRSFYVSLFGCKADGDDIHSIVHLSGLSIAIYNKGKAEAENPAMDYSSQGNDCFYIGFNCEDAETEYMRIKALGIGNPSKPVKWPWGAISFNLRDPDGNVIVIRSWLMNSD